MAVRQADNHKPFIDIRGPAGNAYNILGEAKDISKQLGHSKSQTEAIQTEMMSGDYENLIAVFDKHYGSLVDIVR
jgi:hypothetical protein